MRLDLKRFAALAGETDSPQGVVNTSEGRVVRAFHRFTLVDQAGGGRDLTKGRRRDQGAVKISCARQVSFQLPCSLRPNSWASRALSNFERGKQAALRVCLWIGTASCLSQGGQA